MDPPVVSVVVPTRGRAAYLEVTLDSLLAQRTEAPHEILVVDDGAPDATRAVVEARPPVRYLDHGGRQGLNAARNTGIGKSRAALVAFVDDDVLAPPGWLEALLAGAERHPEAEAFAGPIRARLEGPTPRGCGREEPPITTLDLGRKDRPSEVAWGANFAVRRSAVERIGAFDERIVRPHGDEEEWIDRLRGAGGQVMYLAGAGLEHRRAPGDARLLPLMRAAHARGRAARASDTRRAHAPSLPGELRVLVGCGWHTLRRACPQGLVMGAHAAGRLAEALRPLPSRVEGAAPAGGEPPPEPRPGDYLSGDAGDVTHPLRRAKRSLGELAFAAADRAVLTARRVERLTAGQEPRRVLVASIYRPDSLLPAALPALRSERHDVIFALGAIGAPDPVLASWTVESVLSGGKFENLNRVLAAAEGGPAIDWLLLVDDDLELPSRFLDRFVALCERFDLDLAQPAQTLRSHSAWRVTRRRPASLVRRTRFVEIGPLTAIGRRAAEELVPFPELRFGWGLDLHWAALAAERGWRLGVVDATPVRHAAATVGSSYSRAEAEAEARSFLSGRPYLPAREAHETLVTHRRAPR
jgi:GT2 family glycosyltransferase